jgi:hypothetical protein
MLSLSTIYPKSQMKVIRMVSRTELLLFILCCCLLLQYLLQRCAGVYYYSPNYSIQYLSGGSNEMVEGWDVGASAGGGLRLAGVARS